MVNFAAPSPRMLPSIAPQWLARRPRLFSVLVVLYLGLVYLSLINPYWHITPDSAIYLGLAQNLADGHGYVFNGLPHGKYPSGMAQFLSVALQVSPSFLWINSLLCALMLAGLAVLYLVFRQIIDHPSALLLTALSGSLFWIHEYATVPLTEAPFFLLSNLALLALLALKRTQRDAHQAWLLVAAICGLLATAFWFKVQTAFWLGPFGLALLFGNARDYAWRQRMQHTSALVLTLVICVLAYLAWTKMTKDDIEAAKAAPEQSILYAAGPQASNKIPRPPPTVEVDLESRSMQNSANLANTQSKPSAPPLETVRVWGYQVKFGNNTLHHAWNFPRWPLLSMAPSFEALRHAGIGRILVETLQWLTFAIVLIGSYRALREGQWLLASLLLFLLPFIPLGRGYSLTTGRYAIAILPLLVLTFALGLREIGGWLERLLRRRIRKLLVGAGLLAVALANLPMLIGDIWVARSPDYYNRFRAGAYQDLLDINHWLSAQQPGSRTGAWLKPDVSLLSLSAPGPVILLPGNNRPDQPSFQHKALIAAKLEQLDFLVVRDKSQPWPYWHIPASWLGRGEADGPHWLLFRYDSTNDRLIPISVPRVENWPRSVQSKAASAGLSIAKPLGDETEI